jgi:hypothetical protein
MTGKIGKFETSRLKKAISPTKSRQDIIQREEEEGKRRRYF